MVASYTVTSPLTYLIIVIVVSYSSENPKITTTHAVNITEGMYVNRSYNAVC